MVIAPKINDAENPVPANTIVAVHTSEFGSLDPGLVVQSLKGHKTREWLPTHAYYCLPITIGNQYGFVLKSLHDFTVIWNGGPHPDDTCVLVDDNEYTGHQFIRSHFGNGIVTIQNWFHLRTPPGVNLMTIQPPNIEMNGVMCMTGVVETDNIQRDFTFNFKVLKPHEHLVFKRGDILGAFIPIPRYFVDGFDLAEGQNVFSKEVLASDWKEIEALSLERSTVDLDKPHQAGRRYYRGEDSTGCPYADHQRSVKANGCKKVQTQCGGGTESTQTAT